MRVKENKSFNFSKKSRLKRNIRYLIIHYTGMQSARVSMDRLKNPQSNVSCHYFIMRNGDIFKMVDENRVAWHAGKSKWKSIKNLNNCSIGIEMQNKGHLLGYQNFPKNPTFRNYSNSSSKILVPTTAVPTEFSMGSFQNQNWQDQSVKKKD